MSASVSHLTNDLVLLPIPSQRAALSFSSSSVPETSSRESLRSLYLSLTPPLSKETITNAVQFLQLHEQNFDTQNPQTLDNEEKSLYEAVVGKLVAGIYAQTLDVFLSEASEAENRAEWWAEIERSRVRAVYFLLQSKFP
jgi:nuclear control of ATPase protein 2